MALLVHLTLEQRECELHACPYTVHFFSGEWYSTNYTICSCLNPQMWSPKVTETCVRRANF